MMFCCSPGFCRKTPDVRSQKAWVLILVLSSLSLFMSLGIKAESGWYKGTLWHFSSNDLPDRHTQHGVCPPCAESRHICHLTVRTVLCGKYMITAYVRDEENGRQYYITSLRMFRYAMESRDSNSNLFCPNWDLRLPWQATFPLIF